MGSEYREALLAAARVCEKTGDKFGPGGHQTGAYVCQQKILALAKQEDQGGAAEPSQGKHPVLSEKEGHMQNSPRGEPDSGALQSAPRPNPAGQVEWIEPGKTPGSTPAPPGPETVPVPLNVALHLESMSLEMGGKCHICQQFRDLLAAGSAKEKKRAE